jgi:hypothetical protein
MFELFAFWWDCLRSGLEAGKGVFAFVEVLLLLLWLVFKYRKKKGLAIWEDNLKELSKWAFWILFGFATVIVAPYQKYHAETELRTKTENLVSKQQSRIESLRDNRPTLAADPGYQAMTNELFQTRQKLAGESKRASEVSAQAEEYRSRWLSYISDTNAFVSYLTNAIEILKRDASSSGEPTNLALIDQTLEHRRELRLLEDMQKASEIVPSYNILRYVEGEFQKMLSSARSEFFIKDTNSFPTPGEFIHATTDHRFVITSPNCPFWCAYAVASSPPQMFLSFRGTNTRNAELQFVVNGNTFTANFSIDGEKDVVSKNCAIAKKSQLAAFVDSSLKLIIESQAQNLK